MTGRRGRGTSLGWVAAVAAILVLAQVGGVLHGEGRAGARINEGDIYLGDPKHYKKPAVVDVDAVYAKIPEYRQILEHNLDSTCPRYLYLLRSASERFRKALDRCSRGRGFDLIGGLGSIQIDGVAVPDITADVLKALNG